MRDSFTLSTSGKNLVLGERTAIMGVLNVTPDSFYDGGRYPAPEPAIERGLRMVEQGADIIDIGGQSTRPRSQPLDAATELERVLPVLRGIRPRTQTWISIDTYRSEVARVCIEEGADMINDVSAFRMDPQMPSVIASSHAIVVCMHFLHSIHPMPANPEYKDLFGEILLFFEDTFRMAEHAGIHRERIIVDPGIGFGKGLADNLALMAGLSFLKPLKRPILAGPSRKSFIGKITGEDAEHRLEGTFAAAAICIEQGAHIVRVHDPEPFRPFCNVLDALLGSRPPEQKR